MKSVKSVMRYRLSEPSPTWPDQRSRLSCRSREQGSGSLISLLSLIAAPLLVGYAAWVAKRRGRHPSKALAGSFVHEVKAAGCYADGNGLYLRVDRSGSKRWILRTIVHGRRRDIGLGGFSSVSLIEARVKARALRKFAREGGDPLNARGEYAWASHPEVLKAREIAIERLRSAEDLLQQRI